MVRTINIFLACLLLQCAWNNAVAQPVIWRQYEPGSSYQPVTINKIAQDPYGRMWVGTNKGLFSFDGSDFTYLTFRDSTSLNITALCCDSQFVYMGFEDGKVFHRSLKSWQKEFVADENLSSPIAGILVDSSGRTWMATYGSGVFVRDHDQLQNITTGQGLPGNEIYTMIAGRKGTVWIGTDGGLTQCSLENGKPVLTNYTVNDGLSDEIVRALVMDEYGKIWIGTQDHGICIFDPANKTFEIPAISRNWNHGPVSALAIKDYNRLMIGTLGRGCVSISLHDNFHPVFYNQSTGYENVKVSDIVIDREGNFWVVSATRGLDQFPALFQWIAPSAMDTREAVQAVFYDSNSSLWYATLKGLFKTRIDSAGSNVTVQEKLPGAGEQPVITSIYEDVHHNMWVGTFDDGVFIKPSGRGNFFQVLQRDGLANDNVLSINGDVINVWIATLGGVTYCNIQMEIGERADLILQNFTQESGLHSSYLYQTFIDSKGRVWFATDGNGLKVLDNGVFQSYKMAGNVAINTVYSITEDPFGNIWFSTPSSGLFKYDGKTITNYGLKSGLSDLTITGISTDANGDIVVIENDAIDIIEHKTNQVRRYRGRQIFEGIDPSLNAFSKDRFGNIWIATKKGILKYYAPSPEYAHEAELEIRQVMVYLEPIDISLSNVFRYDQNHFAFDFQAFWNSDPSQLRYRYILVGHDLDWIKTKDERAIYPELKPGTYTFRIQATIHHNFDDAPTAAYTFTIEAPFWTTWWFISGCVVVAGVLVNFLIRERDRRRERDEKLKRERIEFQFENLKAQINPHFLFNSFNTLATLVEEDQSVALSYIDHLSDFYRSLLSYKDTDLIPLEKELELTNNYIFLLQQRHGNRLTVESDIPENYKHRKIPPLTLQLLIENAVKHNVVSQEQPLLVKIFSSDGKRICVRNKIQPKKDVISTGFGLQNIRARCELLGGKGFEVTQTEAYFEVCVPLFHA
ncbi:MAG TPA: two-component regulator propeller domain-containing protein [Chitinophagales bacterium]|nr:two-component regulator propeller domain-containing protein [Chitinophagales bacterium]